MSSSVHVQVWLIVFIILFMYVPTCPACPQVYFRVAGLLEIICCTMRAGYVLVSCYTCALRELNQSELFDGTGMHVTCCVIVVQKAL